jgi:hypothetical protein
MSVFKLVKSIGIYSPLIVIIGVWLVTIFSSDTLKGITYLFLIIFALVLRMTALKIPMKSSSVSDSSSVTIETASASDKSMQCSMGTDIRGDDETLGAYVISYTMWYICLPMFMINDINWGVFSFFLLTLIFNIAINWGCLKGCVPALVTNVISSGLLGVMFSLGVYTYANSLSLVNESSSSAEVCSAPSKQTFKCKVFKNGELVSETTTG